MLLYYYAILLFPFFRRFLLLPPIPLVPTLTFQTFTAGIGASTNFFGVSSAECSSAVPLSDPPAVSGGPASAPEPDEVGTAAALAAERRPRRRLDPCPDLPPDLAGPPLVCFSPGCFSAALFLRFSLTTGIKSPSPSSANWPSSWTWLLVTGGSGTTSVLLLILSRDVSPALSHAHSLTVTSRWRPLSYARTLSVDPQITAGVLAPQTRPRLSAQGSQPYNLEFARTRIRFPLLALVHS